MAFFDIRTDYSLLGSLIQIENLINFAKERSWTYLGIADENAGGLLDFYLACKEAGIKPILGLRFNVTNNLEETTDSQIILYAQNLKGYHNLLKLFSKASIDGFKNNQGNLLIDWVDELGSDIICVLPVGNSPKEAHTKNGDAVISKIKSYFKGKLFCGLYNRNTAIDDIWLKKAEANNIPYLFLTDARYLKSEDYTAYKVLRAIKEKNIVEKLFESIWLDSSLESAAKQFENYKHEEYQNKFLSLIDIDIPTPGLKVPKFAIPKDFATSYDYLVALCREGYKGKIENFDTKEKKEACKNRMKIELDVIKRCELADYFLMVLQICKYCDNNNIPRSFSRGSASGSLIIFLLDISKVNPLDYGLLFERFLNEDRTRPIMFNGEQYLTDCSDIDIDLGQMQRQEVIDWLRDKFGHVAKIATYTTLSSKACLKDVIRSFGKTEAEASYVASFVEVIHGKSDSIEQTYTKFQQFKDWADVNPKIYNVILKIEGIKKNSSIHASGIIISNEPIRNKVPVFLSNCSEGGGFKKDECVAYSLDFASKAGLIKMDLLGIRTLNVLQDAVRMI